MRSRYGLRWFALGLLIAGGQLGVLWRMDAWVPTSVAPFTYTIWSQLDQPKALPRSEGWLLVFWVTIVACSISYVGALDADSGPAVAEDPVDAWRRQHVTAFCYASSVVLWAGIVVLWAVGDASLVSACDRLAGAVPLPFLCFAPRLQLGFTLVLAGWLALLAGWSGAPPGYLRAEDELACVSAGMGWGLLPTLLITSPPFVA